MVGSAWRSVAWCAAYGASVVLARQLLAPESGLALFWPAAGIAVLWLWPRRSRRHLALDLALLGVMTVGSLLLLDSPASVASWLGAANVAQPLVFLALWRRFGAGQPDSLSSAAPRTPRDTLAIVACAVAAALVGSVPGSVAVWVGGGQVDALLWLGWVVRNGSSIAVLTLTVTAVVHCYPLPGGVRRFGVGQPAVGLELVAATLLATTVTLVVFADRDHRPIAFVTLLSAVWFGLRFSPGAASLQALVQGAIAVGLSVQGRGPFGGAQVVAERAVTVQGFVLLTVLVACVLAASVTERRRLLSEAQQSESRARLSAREARARTALVEAITGGIAEGLVVVSPQHRVVLSNRAASDILVGRDRGRTPADDAPTWHPGETLPQRMLAPLAPAATRALAGDRVTAVDVEVTDPLSQARRVLSLSAAPVGVTEDPEDRLAVMLVRDVTEERHAVEELRAFAGVVAHDLKNPVAAIMSWSEILDDQLDELSADASTARATLVRIYATADRVQELVEDLLLYARAGAGDLSPQPVPLATLYDDALVQLPTQSVREAEIDLRCDRDISVMVDAVLVRQLLVNLLGNAVKYCTTTPRVCVQAVREGDWVHVSISDNGVGIPPEERERVFEGFYRSHRTAAQFPGTGLGLAICARAVRRHGGTIGARAAGPEGGTRIDFSLPTAPQRDPGVTPGTG